VDAAEGDHPTLATVGGRLAEAVAVTAEVGEGNHLVLLIMVAQDQQPRAQFGLHRLDAGGELLVRERLVGLEFQGRGERGGHRGRALR
jgi:hypothetical protein